MYLLCHLSPTKGVWEWKFVKNIFPLFKSIIRNTKGTVHNSLKTFSLVHTRDFGGRLFVVFFGGAFCIWGFGSVFFGDVVVPTNRWCCGCEQVVLWLRMENRELFSETSSKCILRRKSINIICFSLNIRQNPRTSSTSYTIMGIWSKS